MNNVSKLVILVFLWLVAFFPLKGQNNVITVSVLTCSPGQELYSIYGHNALRIRDSLTKTDIVYNYGTFDFDTPGFALKFMQGKLPYLLSANYYEDFIYEYQYFQRSVTEQILNIDSISKTQITAFMANNMLPENRAYKYDFFKDNCATRLRDVLIKNIKGLHFEENKASYKTFRQIIKEYQQNSPWTDLGIDLIIGAPADKVTTLSEEMFIPDYLSFAINNAYISQASDQKLLLQQKNILTFDKKAVKPFWLLSPEFVFSLLCIMEFMILIAFSKGQKLSFLRLYDQIWVVLITLCALLMLFMWFGTNHIPTKYNWNILWANLLITVWYYSDYNTKWSKSVMILITICLIVSILNALPFIQILPQFFHPATGLINLILILKGWRLYKTVPPQSDHA